MLRPFASIEVALLDVQHFLRYTLNLGIFITEEHDICSFSMSTAPSQSVYID